MPSDCAPNGKPNVDVCPTAGVKPADNCGATAVVDAGGPVVVPKPNRPPDIGTDAVAAGTDEVLAAAVAVAAVVLNMNEPAGAVAPNNDAEINRHREQNDGQ